MNDLNEKNFAKFLQSVSEANLPTKTTSTGTTTIQQTKRNELRREGMAALAKDLKQFYGPDANFDILVTSDGIVFVTENQPGG